MESKVFLAIYTHECKSYCDDEFFRNIAKFSDSADVVYILDNSPSLDYSFRLGGLCDALGINATIFIVFNVNT